MMMGRHMITLLIHKKYLFVIQNTFHTQKVKLKLIMAEQQVELDMKFQQYNQLLLQVYKLKLQQLQTDELLTT
jgi:hypothetical protein